MVFLLVLKHFSSENQKPCCVFCHFNPILVLLAYRSQFLSVFSSEFYWFWVLGHLIRKIIIVSLKIRFWVSVCCLWSADISVFVEAYQAEVYSSFQCFFTMLSTKSESDITSLAPSSPSRSPKRPVYYVQSPSRDSHDGDKSSSMQPSPMESPSHPSFGRHSRNSSASRFSGIFRSSSGRKGSRKRNEKGWNDKGWPECNVIVEEGDYDEDKAFIRRFQALIALFSFIILFTVFCLIIWGASRPFKAEITVKV